MSQIELPIPQALPQPPDVAAEGKVPGGELLPCLPVNGEPRYGKAWLLELGLGDGFEIEISRFRLAFPVFLNENAGVITENLQTKNETVFETEAEAKEASFAKGGLPALQVTEHPITIDSRYENVEVKPKYTHEANVVVNDEETVIRRSLLPITVTVAVRLIGPDGPIWGDSYDVPISYVQGNATEGEGAGLGLLEEYVDLTNPLTLSSEEGPYGIELLVYMPERKEVFANLQLGVTIENEQAVPGTGGITLYGTPKAVKVNK
jgi:hypothetical protein